ncbi:hypothetical protein NYE25_22020 [Paenibacillus sp. FSL E2-8871]|nr:hypothetical protein [Paenibacillus odorifer]
MFSEYDLDYTWRFKKMSILLDPVSFVCGIKDCSEEGVKAKKI